MHYKLTRHQIARSSRPDAEQFNRMYLIKNVAVLRATYQIRLLAYLAVAKGKTLVLRVSKTCKFDRTLEDLMQTCGKSMERENT